jgi:hypothetical protein|tara:strand:- start:1248 stop:1451 length:204 start_codon:yes stop_codon:yes gene_type:complete
MKEVLSNAPSGLRIVGFDSCLNAIVGVINWRWRRPFWTDIVYNIDDINTHFLHKVYLKFINTKFPKK